jgi:hypothetical protein
MRTLRLARATTPTTTQRAPASAKADWAVRDFNERVNRYVELHHAVAASLGQEVIWSDPPNFSNRSGTSP